jgi:hypothetical protein
MVHARTSLPCERFEIGFQSYARSTIFLAVRPGLFRPFALAGC